MGDFFFLAKQHYWGRSIAPEGREERNEEEKNKNIFPKEDNTILESRVCVC